MNCKLYADSDAQRRATEELKTSSHREPEVSQMTVAWIWLNASWLFWAVVDLVCILIRAATIGG